MTPRWGRVLGAAGSPSSRASWNAVAGNSQDVLEFAGAKGNSEDETWHAYQAARSLRFGIWCTGRGLNAGSFI
jgi:hypothetical protein